MAAQEESAVRLIPRCLLFYAPVHTLFSLVLPYPLYPALILYPYLSLHLLLHLLSLHPSASLVIIS